MTALARKWRPKSFDDYQGQEHVTTSIKHALNNSRVHHAYLFSGTRGVGKTSIARIFAKSLSCTQGISDNPCQKCKHCEAISQGCFIDLIEVDAASKTKVEDTRELLEHAKFMPHSGKFKIFIIDEVHMLSNHSFDALLKTLEEPPEHVKFMLATTDPEKLPITILSRCLHFKLLPLSNNLITEQLSKVLNLESIKFEAEAVANIAKNSGGSMRDALSATDQIISLGSGELTNAAVATLLGLSEPKLVQELMQYIFSRDKQKCLEILNDMNNKGICLEKLLRQLAEQLYEISVKLFCNETIEQKISKEEVHYWYQMIIFGLRDFEYAPNDLIAASMTIMRILDFSCTKTTEPQSPKPEITTSFLEQLDVSGMTKAIVSNLKIVQHDNESIRLSLSEDKKALLTAVHIQRIKDAIKRTGFMGKIDIFSGSDNSNKSSKLSEAFGGTVIN